MTAPNRLRCRLRADRGAALVTYVLLFPVFIMFLELVTIGGRLAVTRADVQSAAREAARQASVASGPSSAGTVIQEAVTISLRDKGFNCQSPSVRMGPSTVFGPPTPLWQGGQVEVVVTCTVQLSDIALLTAPGTVTIQTSAIEPIDRYRVVRP